jgi:hypothetical protein
MRSEAAISAEIDGPPAHTANMIVESENALFGP